jgi:negative regulator of sigma E activity
LERTKTGDGDEREPIVNENISRLMDGELDDPSVDEVCRAMRQGDAMTTWVCYHVIGDHLRGAGSVAPGFSARFASALASEPTVLAPPPRKAAPAMVAWAAAATVAAVAIVGWTAFSMVDTPPTAVARARDASSVRAALVKPASPVPTDYFLAHREYSPAAAVQRPEPALLPASASGF